jgi:hypothetical protein
MKVGWRGSLAFKLASEGFVESHISVGGITRLAVAQPTAWTKKAIGGWIHDTDLPFPRALVRQRGSNQVAALAS